MPRLFLIITMVFLLGVLLIGNYSPETPSMGVIQMEKIHCKKCAEQIYSILMKTPGVKGVDIDFKSSLVRVTYFDSKVNLLMLERKLAEEGFSTSRVKSIYKRAHSHGKSEKTPLFQFSVEL